MKLGLLNQEGRQDYRRGIFERRPDSHEAEDYLALCKEVIGRG
jgi:hypothetical protein